jgi:hypothetical protein
VWGPPTGAVTNDIGRSIIFDGRTGAEHSGSTRDLSLCAKHRFLLVPLDRDGLQQLREVELFWL